MKLWETGDISIGSLQKGGLGINMQPSGYVYLVSSLFGAGAWYNAVIANNNSGYANLVYRESLGHVSWDRGDGYRYARLSFGTNVYGPGMENVEELQNSLDLITSITGVSYYLQVPSDNNTTGMISTNGTALDPDLKSIDGLDSLPESTQSVSIKCFGFRPSELEELFPEFLTTIPEKDKGIAVNFDAFIPYLVEAIKELNKKVDILESGHPTMKSALSDNDLDADVERSVLFQNSPNPFSTETTIRFKLSSVVKGASIILFDMQGKLIKSYNSLQNSCCKVTINSHELQPGMYLYTLLTDGNEVGTKRLILTD